MNCKFDCNKKSDKKEAFESEFEKWNKIFQQKDMTHVITEKSWYDSKSDENSCVVEDKPGRASEVYKDVTILAPEFWSNGGISAQMLQIPLRIVLRSNSNKTLTFTMVKLCYGNKAEIRLEENNKLVASFFAVTENGENISLKEMLSEALSIEKVDSAVDFISGLKQGK
ncbi:MAG: hypothetical protein IKO57_13355 [Treponema sp.]|nr:hypothetical protein [Treponema sp.]